MIKLKPCPFCGSNDVFIIELPYVDGNTHIVKCANCETYGPRWNSSDEEGIKAWNERKTQICMPDTVNLIETYLDGYKKGMHDTEELLKPFVKEGVLND